VLVKHLARAGLSMDRFEMLLVTARKPGISAVRWWILACASRWASAMSPAGCCWLSCCRAGLRDALEHVTAAVYEIMLATKNMQEYELQVVAAQDRIAQPEHYFSATQL
jgi:pyridoxine kinase